MLQCCVPLQDKVRNLQLKLSEARQQYAALTNGSIPLDQQLAEAQQLEAKIKDYEQQLRQLQSQGDIMMAQDPKIALPVELSTLQSHWLDLQRLVSANRFSQREYYLLIIKLEFLAFGFALTAVLGDTQ